MTAEGKGKEGDAGPLAGIRVLEMGSLIAGPFATRILADFGAEVIKLEPPGKGDPLREWSLTTEYGSLWSLVQSRNKRSVSLDLRRARGQEIARRLAAACDVVVENFRPGRLEEWGLGYEELSRENPGLILVRISGFGQTGPYRNRPGFGSVGEAMGGLRYITGYPDRPPLRVGISLGDALASLYAVIGTLMALHHRQASGDGRGQVVDVALYEAVFSLLESILPEYAYMGKVRERTGNALKQAAPSNIYPTADGKWVAIGANGDAIFRRFVAAMGQAGLADDPRFRDHQSRSANLEVLDGIIGEWTRTLPMAELWRILDDAHVPAGPVYSIADIAADPQFLAREMILHVADPRLGQLVMPGIVPRLAGSPGRVQWPGPDVGQDTREVLARWLGLSPAELDVLHEGEVI